MIYVNQKQLDQVEYILEQSTRGHHVLFDLDEIRQVFHDCIIIDDEPIPQDRVTEAEKHIENLILQPTLLSKKIYLENLTPEAFTDVVRTYFSIVENNVFEGMKYCQ